MLWLRQSTAVDVPMGPFVDDTDGKTPETALTISQADVRLKKGGNAWAQKNDTTSATHEENGNNKVPLNSTDTTNVGLLRIHVNETGALPVWEQFFVLPTNVFDSMIGTDKLQVDLVSIEDVAATPLRRSMSTIKVFTVGTGSTTTVIETNL